MSDAVVTTGPTRSRSWLALELLLLAAGAAVVLTLTLISPPGGPPAPTFAPTVLGGQPPGAVVLAREDRNLAVALAVQPGREHLTLVATVLAPDGTGATGLDVAFRTTTGDDAVHDSDARPCGPGCYAATVATRARPTLAAVTVTGPGSNGRPLRFVLPARWPPRAATDLVHATERAYTRLRTLVTHERLGFDPTHVLHTTYRAVAPDELRITSRITSQDGSEAVVLGRMRWDRQAGQPWLRSERLTNSGPVRAIAPYWGGAVVDATLLGSATIRGRPTWVVSFATPQYPAFFTIWIDKTTRRTLQLRMTASAHFMHHTYGPFDKPLTVTPPLLATANAQKALSGG